VAYSDLFCRLLDRKCCCNHERCPPPSHFPAFSCTNPEAALGLVFFAPADDSEKCSQRLWLVDMTKYEHGYSRVFLHTEGGREKCNLDVFILILEFGKELPKWRIGIANNLP
jgi:hypothetical protein